MEWSLQKMPIRSLQRGLSAPRRRLISGDHYYQCTNDDRVRIAQATGFRSRKGECLKDGIFKRGVNSTVLKHLERGRIP
jgi:hypothetical protein